MRRTQAVAGTADAGGFGMQDCQCTGRRRDQSKHLSSSRKGTGAMSGHHPEGHFSTVYGMLGRGILVWLTCGIFMFGNGGCVPWYQPGDQGFEGSVHIWPSQEHRPATVTLYDTRTGEAVWTIDVPPGKWLATRFRTGMGNDEVYRPDLLEYSLFDEGRAYGQLRSSISVPGDSSRRLELTIRDGVKYEAYSDPLAHGSSDQ